MIRLSIPQRLPNADPAWPDGERARSRIARLARVMVALCIAMIIGLVLYLGLVAWLAVAFPERIAASTDAHGLSGGAYLAIGVCWMAAQGFLIWGLWSGRSCFASLAEGELFAAASIRGLRNFAIGLFLYKAMSAAMFVVAAAAARLKGVRLPPSADITMQDFGEGAFTLVSLGAIVVITALLAHATEIAEDHAQVV